MSALNAIKDDRDKHRIQLPLLKRGVSAMISSQRIALSLALAGSAFAASIQAPNIVLPPSAAANRAAVEAIFTESYAAYT